MSEKKKSAFSTQMIVFIGLLVAIEIILERVIAIPVGNITRFSVGKVVVILSGMWLGPIPGALVGAISDVLGGLLQGYGLSINPIITLSSMMWGIIPALCMPLIKGTRKRKAVAICLAVVVNAVVSTLCLTTLGLVVVYGYNFFALMPTRLVQFAALTPTYCILTILLFFSPLTNLIRNAVGKKTV